MGKHRDWTEIENDYLENGLSYSQLAKKYDVSISTLKKAAMRQGWGKKRSGSEQKVERIEAALSKMEPGEMEPGNRTTVVDRETPNQKFQRIVDEMLDRVEDAICMVNPADAQSIKLLASALKDMRDLKHLNKSALDIEEQKARIAKLQSETRIFDSDDAGGVLVLPVIEGKLIPPEDGDE